MEIRDNLLDRIAEAEREGWLGEIEGLRVSLAGSESKIDQIDSAPRSMAINLGMPRKAPGEPARNEGAALLRQSLDDQQ
ncbi:hypothetical protein OG912_37270 [Streptomyces sp. NBC_00464]|uniref:hypothetical protein n=1 Tax=Streptomyces sp. NBC_00464 TaxID=2975751 RepID=UPI002E17C0B9